jgi:hypothetical protein
MCGVVGFGLCTPTRCSWTDPRQRELDAAGAAGAVEAFKQTCMAER